MKVTTEEIRLKWVSILVLLEAVFQHGMDDFVSRHSVIGFNPCFAGSCFSTFTAAVGIVSIFLVSILVLLEAVFQPDRAGRTQENDRLVSILVLLEAVFQPKKIQLHNNPHERYVSILVLLEAVFQQQ